MAFRAVLALAAACSIAHGAYYNGVAPAQDVAEVIETFEEYKGKSRAALTIESAPTLCAARRPLQQRGGG